MHLFDMKEWVIRVIITVFSFSVISLILPNGSVSKFIKQLFSVLMIFIIIQPLFSAENLSIDKNNQNLSYQVDYIEYVNNKKVQSFTKKIDEILNELGIENSEIEILYYADENNKFNFDKVVVNLRNCVISSDREHIDIIDQAKSNIADYLGVEENIVLIYDKKIA